MQLFVEALKAQLRTLIGQLLDLSQKALLLCKLRFYGVEDLAVDLSPSAQRRSA